MVLTRRLVEDLMLAKVTSGSSATIEAYCQRAVAALNDGLRLLTKVRRLGRKSAVFLNGPNLISRERKPPVFDFLGHL